ncbi:MAG: ABC transporter substrate-binding protein [Cyanobacteria bacterium P01_G01_bin.19]
MNESDRYKDKEISIVFLAPGVIFSEGKNSFPDYILQDLGLQRPEAQNEIVPYTQIYFSLEELEKADGDIMFVGTLGDEDEEYLEQLKQKPLWKNLRAVRQDRVYPINYLTWRGGNLLAAETVIDDLYKYLADSEESEESEGS